MRNTILSCLPFALLASAASAATKLPDVEVNLDQLHIPAAVTPATSAAVPTFSAPAAAVPPAPINAPVAAPAPQPLLGGEPATMSYPATAPAPVVAERAMPEKRGYVEVGGDYHSLSDDLDTWRGQYVRGEYQVDTDNRLSGELMRQHEFGEQGYYAGLGITHDFNEDWYGSLSVGGGAPSEATFFPRYRTDAFINRKWLERRQLITTFGLGYSKSMQRYNDTSGFIGATYYFEAPWVVSGGYRLNNSNPGSVWASSGFLAVSQGRAGDYLLTARYGYGREAYQLLGAGIISDFNSQSRSLRLRKWISDGWGFDVMGENYRNPNYNRNGVNFGVFKEF